MHLDECSVENSGYMHHPVKMNVHWNAGHHSFYGEILALL